MPAVHKPKTKARRPAGRRGKKPLTADQVKRIQPILVSMNRLRPGTILLNANKFRNDPTGLMRKILDEKQFRSNNQIISNIRKIQRIIAE